MKKQLKTLGELEYLLDELSGFEPMQKFIDKHSEVFEQLTKNVKVAQEFFSDEQRNEAYEKAKQQFYVERMGKFLSLAKRFNHDGEKISRRVKHEREKRKEMDKQSGTTTD